MRAKQTDINGWNPRQVAELNGHLAFQELLIHRNVKDKQPVLERLPEVRLRGISPLTFFANQCLSLNPFLPAAKAPWHGDLWTRVMDAQHKKRADYERSMEVARKREEEIRQGE